MYSPKITLKSRHFKVLILTYNPDKKSFSPNYLRIESRKVLPAHGFFNLKTLFTINNNNNNR